MQNHVSVPRCVGILQHQANGNGGVTRVHIWFTFRRIGASPKHRDSQIHPTTTGVKWIPFCTREQKVWYFDNTWLTPCVLLKTGWKVWPLMLSLEWYHITSQTLVTSYEIVSSIWLMKHINGSWKQQRAIYSRRFTPWWRHQMETFSALPYLLALCVGMPPVIGGVP